MWSNKILLIIFFQFSITFSQTKKDYKPIRYRTKKDYFHKVTNNNFSKELDTLYKRKDIYFLNRSRTDISVSYESNQKDLVTLYLYETGASFENKLRYDYFNSLSEITTLSSFENGINFTQEPVQISDSLYTSNGMKATYNNEKSNISSLSIYECGAWSYKLKTTLNSSDTIKLKEIENYFFRKFNPNKLISLKKLDTLANLYMHKTAFRDSTLLGCSMASAYKKIEWAYENIKPKERASGFPSQYLKIHVEALKEFSKFDKEKKMSKTPYTENYLMNLNKIIDNGYLDEFIMKEYNMALIVNKKHEFDFEEYEIWKTKNNIKININDSLYSIVYEIKK